MKPAGADRVRVLNEDVAGNIGRGRRESNPTAKKPRRSGCRQKKKAAGRRPFSSAGWFFRGPRPRAELGGRSQRGTLRKHRSEGYSARPLFQSCFVERGNGFV